MGLQSMQELSGALAEAVALASAGVVRVEGREAPGAGPREARPSAEGRKPHNRLNGMANGKARA